MSDTAGDGGQGSGTASNLDVPSGDQGSPVAPQAPVGAPQGGGDDSLAPGFLSAIPESDRPIVEKYVKDWDAGVTQRFQQIQSELGWARELQQQGLQPDDVNSAVRFWNLLDTNPQMVLNILQQQLQPESGSDQGQSGGQQQQPAWLQEMPPEMQQAWQEHEQQLGQQQKALEAVAEFLMNQRNQTQAQTEDQQLDQLLGAMRQQHGDFDESYVLTQMMNGSTPEQALAAYNGFVQNIVSQQDRNGRGPGANAPPVLGGGGAALPDGFDPRKASGKDVRNMVAEMARQAAANEQ
jgi:hypothetical protein